MWFDGIRKENTLYVASVSRGKDSTAMIRAIQLMGWPLDAIVSVDIWFDETTPAELPPMVAFKDEWDRKCAEWFGVPVTRLCARKREPTTEMYSRLTYKDIFYRKVPPQREKELGVNQTSNDRHLRIPKSNVSLVYWRAQECGNAIKGFPWRKGAWCQDRLKGNIADRVFRTAPERGAENKYRSLYRNSC